MALMLLTEAQRHILLDLVRQSIQHGLATDKPLTVDLTQLPPEVQAPGATFVTLNINDKLRGCIGMLEARRPLAQDIADNAFAAAFRDSRFPPVQDYELDRLKIHLSLLSKPEPLLFRDEGDLLAQIKFGTDGLILQEGGRRATFLPSVWDSLSEKKEFLRHLKQKAGLPPDYWSDRLQCSRYRVDLIE